jgi:MFS family permease
VTTGASAVPSLPSAERPGLVRSLTAATFLQWLGASAILPLLPEFLQSKGSSAALVGVTMAAFFAAGVLTQYPAGRLADRRGRRTVLVGGLLLYAAASIAYLVPEHEAVYVLLRAAQGIGAGAVEVASLALVSSAVPVARRGRAFASIYGGMCAGIAIGPVVGSIAGVERMPIIFVAAGVLSCLACIPVVRSASPDVEGATPPAERRRARALLNRAVVGALLGATAFGLLAGVYEACWTLLLEAHGAKNWQIGLSWTLFSVPFVVMARAGGWMADHADRRVLAIGGLTTSALLCASYPFIHNVALLVALGAVEGTGVALSLPAAQSLLAQWTPAEDAGRVQGLFTTSETAATALGAVLGGVLFGVALWAPFVSAAAGALLLIGALVMVWARVAGRVSDTEGTFEPTHVLG